MPIVQYSEDKKTFDVALALSDGGWNVRLVQLLDVRGLRLTDRNDPAHHVTVSHITHERFFNMYFVYYLEGGWQCLDHAIEQFKRFDVVGLTRNEFEQNYAERSHTTVEWLHANGRHGVPCDCGEEGCRGWQMIHPTPPHSNQAAQKGTRKWKL